MHMYKKTFVGKEYDVELLYLIVLALLCKNGTESKKSTSSASRIKSASLNWAVQATVMDKEVKRQELLFLLVILGSLASGVLLNRSVWASKAVSLLAKHQWKRLAGFLSHVTAIPE